MTPAEAARRNSFVIRIWREPGRSGWKGWVQHTGSGQSTFFQHFCELQEFVERWVGAADEPVQSGLR